jgi:hypothetical protein
VRGGKGQTGPITVHGNFTLPEDLGGHLVITSGAIQEISVDGNIGGSVSLPLYGKIEGTSIKSITSGQSILLNTIRSTGGVINEVTVAKSLKSAVEAKGGNIDLVEAGEIDGNITSSASDPTNPDTGGTIRRVVSTNAIPENVTIKAMYYIGQIIVTNADAVAEKFRVYAASGGFGAGQKNKHQLIINVGKGTFVGIVSLGVPPGSKVKATNFQDGDLLLRLVQKTNQETDWTVSYPQDPNATTTVSVKFAMLKTGSFGLVKKSLKLSDTDFTIEGASGDQAD